MERVKFFQGASIVRIETDINKYIAEMEQKYEGFLINSISHTPTYSNISTGCHYCVLCYSHGKEREDIQD